MDLLKNKTGQYLLLKREEADIKAKLAQIKDQIVASLADAPENSRGSKVHTFEDPIQVFDTGYRGVQYVRKESEFLDEEAVFAWLDTLPEGTSDDWNLVVTEQHIDPDALWHIFVLDLIDEDTMNSFVQRKSSWALQTIKE